MKLILITFMSVMLSLGVSAQAKINIYNPDADAKADISAAVKIAAAQGKQVFLQIGGNWCPWFISFHKMV